MRLPWFPLADQRGKNTGQAILWCEYGFYLLADAGLGQLFVDFYHPSKVHERNRLGTFLGHNSIDEAEKTVQRHLARLQGNPIIEGQAHPIDQPG